MKIGSSDISAAYIGSTAVNKIYIGSTEVWSSFTGLLDTYTGAAAAYSLRLLSASYTGSAIKVRRASDNTEQDIGFSNNELDTTTLASFCSGTNGFVTTWYDQSGNGNNATQTTAASQPKIYDSSTGVITENGKAAVQFDGNDDQLTHNITGLALGNFTYIDTFSSSDTAATLHSSTTTNTKWVMISQTSTSTQFSDGFVTAYDGYYKNGSAALSIGATRTDLKNAFFDGVQNLAFYYGTTNSVVVTSMHIGRYQRSGFHFNGLMQESILYTSDQSSNRIGIETNINNFYSIY